MGKSKWFFMMIAFTLALLPGSTGRGLAHSSAMSPTPPPPPKEEIAAMKRLQHAGDMQALIKSGLSAPRTQPRQPVTLPGIYGWTKIAFQSFLGDNYEVIVAMGNGSNPQRLTFDPANDGRARLNRGANQVVFSSNRDGDFEIYTMNVDGSNLRQLTFNGNTDARPAWSPDGKKIAYWSDETGHAEIYVINADGSGKTQLTSSNGLDCYDPTWSPDGNKIAYVTWDAKGYGYLWTISPTGGMPYDPFTPDPLLFPGDPVWSPDGTRIALDVANQSTYFSEYFYIGNVFGGYYETHYISNQTTYEDHLLGAWAPDGKEFIFNRIQYTVVDNKLYIANAFIDTSCIDTGAGCQRPELRIPGSGLDFLPDWQSADIVPPASQIVPLPAYSRVDGFPLKWTVQNGGPAQLTGFNLQIRQNQGQWGDWYLFQNPTLSEFINGFSPGDVLDFRLQAYDEAGNQEAMTSNPNGDAHTTLYTFDVKGLAADLRDQPVPAAALAIDPAAANTMGVNADGSYRAYLLNREAYTITAQAAGYGKPFDTPRNPRSDMQQDLYFPPVNDLIHNRGFEDQALSNWQIKVPISSTDHLTATRQVDYRASGAAALTLGSACQEPCFSPPETYYSAAAPVPDPANSPMSQDNRVAIAVRGDGTTLILAWETGGLKAFQRSPNGAWSAPATLDSSFASSAVPTYLKLTPSGGAVAIWLSPGSGVYRMASKPPAGNWGSPVDLPIPIETINLRDVAMDSSGGLYLLYLKGDIQSGYDLYYSYRTPAGSWQNPILVFTRLYSNSQIDKAAMATTPDHFLHVFWAYDDNPGYTLMYRRLNLAGEVYESLPLFRHVFIGYAPMLALADGLGQVHLIYQEHQTTHVMRYTDGSWSARESLPDDAGWVNSAAAQGTSLYVMGMSGFLRFTPGQGWSLSSWKPDTVDYALGLDVNGLLQAADETNYYKQARAAADESVSVTQKLTVPASLHEPTLSFQAQLRGPQGLKSTYYEASITQGITMTQVFSNNLASPWGHHWLALDAWAGKEITITFTLHQGAGDPLAYLDLDDISLGSWETPVIDAVTPAALPEPAGQVITITGQNFIQKPQVRIGQTTVPAADVTWSDENTLQVKLPAGLSLGDQDLRVTNPGGQVAILPGGLRFGHFSFVPLLQR
jgi:Tol biopolymer transport system component